MNDRAVLRKQLTQQRQELPLTEQKKCSQQASKLMISQLIFQRAERIACYLAVNGELDPHPIIEHIWERRKHCYLPVLHPVQAGKLCFGEFRRDDPLRHNRYGIPEPALKPSQLIPTWSLDLVITPLVAFDENGFRLGTGGGYYDRTFAFTMQETKNFHVPALVGFAYEFQKQNNLAAEQWDIPLSAIVTEQTIYYVKDNFEIRAG